MIRTVIVCAFAALLPAQDSVAGTWHGKIDLKVLGALKFQVTLTPKGESWEGTIDIPEQGARGLDLDKVSVDGAKVHFELAAGPGRAKWDGRLSDGVIEGTFRQGLVKGAFEMKPGKLPAVGFKPTKPPTYRSEEVKIPAGKHVLAGTLTIPPGTGPFPAAVLVTGSGAQTRDEIVAGFAVFGHLADHLSRNGVCVLRCDDRGTGDSSGKFKGATSLDFADDAQAALAWLQQRKEVDAKRAGIIGHSEGGLIAPIVAARTDSIGFIVLLAGPGVNGMEILLEQGKLIAEANGASKEEIADQEAIQRAAFSAVKGKTTWEDVEKVIADAIERGVKRGDASAKRAALNPKAAIATQIDRLKSPWMKTFLLHEPAPVLAKVKCPVLALFGEKDLQVPPLQSAPVMRKVFKESGNERAVITTIDGANHLFQTSKTGSPNEYASLEKAFAPGFVEAILAFVK